MECRIDDLDDPRSQLPRGVSVVVQTGGVSRRFRGVSQLEDGPQCCDVRVRYSTL